MRGLPKHLRGLSAKEIIRKWHSPPPAKKAAAAPSTVAGRALADTLIPEQVVPLIVRAASSGPNFMDLMSAMRALELEFEAMSKPPWPNAKRVTIISDRLSMEGRDVAGLMGWGVHLPDEPEKWYVAGDAGWFGSWPLNEVAESETATGAPPFIALDAPLQVCHCDECGSVYRTKSALRLHRETVHDQPPTRSEREG